MSWPRQLAITFRRADGQPARDLLVDVRILMERKNDYPLGPFLTDDSGAIRLRSEDVAEEVHQIQSEALMDYDPIDLDRQARFRVGVSAEDSRSLRARAEAVKPFYPDHARKVEGMLVVATNPETGGCEMTIEVDETTTEFVVDLHASTREDEPVATFVR